MKKSSKSIIGIVAVVVIISLALLLPNSGLFQGRLQRPTRAATAISYHGVAFDPWDGERAWIEFGFSSRVDGYRVDIYDLRENVVRSSVGASYRTYFANSPSSVAWDGKDANGRIVPAGGYLYKIYVVQPREDDVPVQPAPWEPEPGPRADRPAVLAAKGTIRVIPGPP